MNLNFHTLNFVCSSSFILMLVVSCECQTLETNNNTFSSNFLFDLLNIAEKAVHSAKKYIGTEIRSDDRLAHRHPLDCAEIRQQNTDSASGVYKVWPQNRISKGPIAIYCDMSDDGGAWTVIQRRGDYDSEKDYFYRDWASYKDGFGDPSKDFWVGNDNIFALTNQRANILKFVLSDWEGNYTYAVYDEFWIDDEAHNYTMHVTGYRGNAGDGFSFTNGHPFTTKDRDNDKYENNCAVLYKGAWWYTSCHASNLNGQYLKGAHESYADGVEWSPFRGQHYSLKNARIKIRPKDFHKNVKLDVTPQ